MKNFFSSSDLNPQLFLAQGQPPSLISFLPFIFTLLLIYYLLLIRPQRKRQKLIERKKRLMEKGDRVLTYGGIYAKVVGIDKEKAVVTVTIDGQVKMELAANAIAEVLVTEEAFKKREEKNK